MLRLARFVLPIVRMSFFTLIASSFAAAQTYCDLKMDEGTVCSIAVYDLHPTQTAVGMRQVQSDVSSIQDMNTDALRDYVKEKKIPIIIGPDGNFYMIDRHHFVSSLFAAKGHRMPLLVAKIEKNWSDDSQQKFWKKMYQKEFVYLFDENGLPLTDHRDIPDQISELKNDSYRSLAWAVRERDGFDKTDIPFAEFRWANYFRSRIEVGNTDAGFETAVNSALQISRGSDASHLPGYKN